MQVHVYACMLMHAKLQELACAHTVALNSGMHTQDRYTQYMRDEHHKLALGFPHYMCGVITGTIAVDNELQLTGFFIIML